MIAMIGTYFPFHSLIASGRTAGYGGADDLTPARAAELGITL
jgi:hypothetical protein